MYEAQRTEENPTAARAKCSLIRGVLKVWEQGDIASDEALRQMLSIFQGAFITPFGTQLRESHAAYDASVNTDFPVPNNGALVGSTTENRANPFCGSEGF